MRILATIVLISFLFLGGRASCLWYWGYFWHCPLTFRSLDHLSGVKNRGHLQYNAEVGLKEAFQSITGKVDKSVKDGVERMARRIALAISKVRIWINLKLCVQSFIWPTRSQTPGSWAPRPLSTGGWRGTLWKQSTVSVTPCSTHPMIWEISLSYHWPIFFIGQVGLSFHFWQYSASWGTTYQRELSKPQPQHNTTQRLGLTWK